MTLPNLIKNHSFNIEIAMKYGVNNAIFLCNMAFWTDINRSKKDHLHNGLCWTYNTHESFAYHFPYWTVDQIRTVIKNLINNNLIVEGNYNKSKFDKTKWYALTEKGLLLFYSPPSVIPDEILNKTPLQPAPLSIWENSQMEPGEFPDRAGESPRPIPDTKHQILNKKKKDNNYIVDSSNSTRDKKEFSNKNKKTTKSYQDDKRFMRFYTAYPKKQQPQDAYKAFKSLNPDDALLEQIIADVELRKKEHSQWQDKQYVSQPARYLRSREFEGEIFNQEAEIKQKKEAQRLENEKRIAAQEEFSKKQNDYEIKKHQQHNKDALIFKKLGGNVKQQGTISPTAHKALGSMLKGLTG